MNNVLCWTNRDRVQCFVLRASTIVAFQYFLCLIILSTSKANKQAKKRTKIYNKETSKFHSQSHFINLLAGGFANLFQGAVASFFIQERLIFGLRLNFSYIILRISASNVLKMFLNITVGIDCAGVIFHSYKPTGKVTGTFIKSAATLAGKKEL